MSRFRSKQSRELRRRLMARLVLAWVAYTVAFAGVAAVLDATVVRPAADAFANRVSPWQYWYDEDYPLDECLRMLGLTIEESAIDPRALAALEQAAADAQAAQEGGDAPASIAIMDADGMSMVSAEQVDEAAYEEAMVFLVGASDSPEAERRWMTAEDIRREALGQQAAMAFGFGEGVVTQPGDGYVAARDLAPYYAVRSLKVPVALGLYLLGCIAIVLVAMDRALKSFDELSGAVAGMVADRARPVELPPGLAIAQDELNAIRLSALSDERAAVAAERRKDELVAYLAHDIKTPLTSVVGYLELLDEAPDLPEPTRRRYVRLAFEKASRFGSLIDEFFEITRYNLQAIPLERSAVAPRLFLEQVAEELYPAAEARNVSIQVNAPEGEGLYIDPGKMARAIGNVLRNAVAYADEGSAIAVEAHLERVTVDSQPKGGEGAGDPSPDPTSAQTVSAEAPGASQQWRISVANRGREISEAHLQSIFDKFYREDGARSTNGGGAGLGLAIAKEIVAAHGGTIEAASADGRTVFTVTLPASAREGDDRAPVA